MATIDEWGVPEEYRDPDGSIHCTAITISDLTLSGGKVITDINDKTVDFPFRTIIGEQICDRIFNKGQTKVLLMARYEPSLRATDIIIIDHPEEWPRE